MACRISPFLIGWMMFESGQFPADGIPFPSICTPLHSLNIDYLVKEGFPSEKLAVNFLSQPWLLWRDIVEGNDESERESTRHTSGLCDPHAFAVVSDKEACLSFLVSNNLITEDERLLLLAQITLNMAEE